MNIPPHVQQLLDKLVRDVQRDPMHALPPYRRLELYNAFGPTAASSSFSNRIYAIENNQLHLTQADRIRARLALITAQHVLPVWLPLLQEADILSADTIGDELRYYLSELLRLETSDEVYSLFAPILDDRETPIDYQALRDRIIALDSDVIARTLQAILLEYLEFGEYVSTAFPLQALSVTIAPALAEHRSIYNMPTALVPTHILQLAEGVLNGTVAPANALSQSGDIHNCFGNCLGYEEETFPARAYDAAWACYEALKQALGLGPFDGEQITPTTTDGDLLGEGSAAAAAHKAFSGIFEDNISTTEFDADKQHEFWRWWLTEAIPQAWADEPDAEDPPDLPTMPFTETVHVTRYRIGTFDLSSDDDASFYQTNPTS